MSGFFSTLALTVGGCATSPTASGASGTTPPERAPKNDAQERSVLRTSMPNPDAFRAWKKASDEPEKLDPFALPEKLMECAQSELLTPTHPQMNARSFYQAKTGTYDVSKLVGGEEACKSWDRSRNQRGPVACLAADTLNYVIISDTYRDACGNLYRGFSEAFYFQRHESPGSRFSKGRVSQAGSASQSSVAGATYAVPLSEMLLLTELLPGDEALIRSSRAAAAKEGLELDPETQLWKKRAR